ncbi:MAG: formate dehydrogenase accessory sulfurtransferase FdhD [Vulcanimicrobiaceae bacterium]
MIPQAAAPRPGRTVQTRVVAHEGARQTQRDDAVVTEEPLEIRIVVRGAAHTVAVTMRTPGNDFELAAGFLYGEGIVRSRDEIDAITYCVDAGVDVEQRYNIVNVALCPDAQPELARFERHFTMSSSCGVCGRAQLDSLHRAGMAPVDDPLAIPAALLYELPERMREAQRVFKATGGLHAAALFDGDGNAIDVREDIGRHNAVDKIAGSALMSGRMPLANRVLTVSGRASYEILQKSAAARIPIVCAVSAPSSLAVELAREFNITLCAFVRSERANVYSVPERITP